MDLSLYVAVAIGLVSVILWYVLLGTGKKKKKEEVVAEEKSASLPAEDGKAKGRTLSAEKSSPKTGKEKEEGGDTLAPSASTSTSSRNKLKGKPQSQAQAQAQAQASRFKSQAAVSDVVKESCRCFHREVGGHARPVLDAAFSSNGVLVASVGKYRALLD